MTEIPRKLNVFKLMITFFVIICLFMSVVSVQAKSQSRQKAKGLDEQVLDIKSEALAIAKELDQLEERLLYPSHTQISIFVSLRKKQTFRLDSVHIELDGKKITSHLYSAKELDALKMGGVQKIYTGNVTIGSHKLEVTMRGLTASGDDVRLEKSFPIKKEVTAGIAELMLAERSITLVSR